MSRVDCDNTHTRARTHARAHTHTNVAGITVLRNVSLGSLTTAPDSCGGFRYQSHIIIHSDPLQVASEYDFWSRVFLRGLAVIVAIAARVGRVLFSCSPTRSSQSESNSCRELRSTLIYLDLDRDVSINGARRRRPSPRSFLSTIFASSDIQKTCRQSSTTAPHKDFSDVHEEMSGKGESASEAHLAARRRPTLQGMRRRQSTERRRSTGTRRRCRPRSRSRAAASQRTPPQTPQTSGPQ